MRKQFVRQSLANARLALEEAFAPRLQSMLTKKLKEEELDLEDEESEDEISDEVEEGSYSEDDEEVEVADEEELGDEEGLEEVADEEAHDDEEPSTEDELESRII